MSLLDEIAGTHQKILNPVGGCRVCPRARIDYVPATLLQGPLLWLGEAPGATEVETQEGFTGKSGELLRREAREAGVPGPWSFSNAVHCRPPDNATPKPKEIECCLRQFVLDEISSYSIVVLVGSVPLQALFPGAMATHFRGNLAYHPDFPGQRFYAIYHPAYMLRRPDLLPEFRKQMNRLARIVKGESPPSWTILRGDEALASLRKMVARPLISLDLETNSVRSWEPGATIRSYCVTTDGKTIAALHQHDPQFQAGLDLIVHFLQQTEKGVAGANVSFDVEWLEREFGFRAQCTGIHDAAIWWYEARQYKQTSLKQLVSEQLDGYRYLVYEPHVERDPTLLLNYNAEDVIYSLQLVQKAVKELGPRTIDLTSRVLGPASMIFRRMQAHGFYLRQDYWRAKIDEYKEKRKVAVEAWTSADPEFVPKLHESGKGLIKYLFDIRKLPVVGQTETGDPSTDASTIKKWIRDGNTYLEHLLTIRKIDKRQNTFIEALEGHVGIDSRVHPRFWLTSTDTSRPSSSDPNLFNIPRVKEIRDLYGVPAGSVMVEWDLSQIEFRIMVCRANDENGIAGYARGEDAHTMTARKITGNPNPTKEQRSQAKPINFGFIYGAKEWTVQQIVLDDYGIEWSDEEASNFRKLFMEAYPRLPHFHEDSKKRLIANQGHFESVTGHKWFYHDWNHPDQGRRDHTFRAALNSEGQGPAANICFYIAVLARRKLDERGFGKVAFVNSVYDSIMAEVPDPKWVPDVIHTVFEVTQQVYEWVRPWMVVPLVIEAATGESWGSLKEWKE